MPRLVRSLLLWRLDYAAVLRGKWMVLCMHTAESAGQSGSWIVGTRTATLVSHCFYYRQQKLYMQLQCEQRSAGLILHDTAPLKLHWFTSPSAVAELL